MTALFDDNEIREIILSKTRTILSRTNSAMGVFTSQRTWRAMRRELLNISSAINELDMFIKNQRERGILLMDYPLNFDSILKDGNNTNLNLINLARAEIDPNSMDYFDQVGSEIIDLLSDMLKSYSLNVALLEKDLNSSLSTPIVEIDKMLSKYPEFVDGNWAIAVSHLALMDSIVNIMRHKYNLANKDRTKDANIAFQVRYNELKEYLSKNGVDIDPGIISRATVLWSLRTEIMHYGMEPNKEETNLVMKWSNLVIEAFKSSPTSD